MRHLLVSACFIGCALAPAAYADTIRVPYIKSDLTTEAGLARLYEKVDKAAKTLCKSDFSMAALVSQSAELECRQEAVRQAIYAEGAPALIAYYESTAKAGNAATRSKVLASR
jgi:UrcA family protein